jgi:hypothetical protein
MVKEGTRVVCSDKHCEDLDGVLCGAGTRMCSSANVTLTAPKGQGLA